MHHVLAVRLTLSLALGALVACSDVPDEVPPGPAAGAGGGAAGAKAAAGSGGAGKHADLDAGETDAG